MNANLGKRLDALEQLAEDVRRREIREQVTSLMEARDLTPVELEQAVDHAIKDQDRITEWRRAGLSEREVLQRFADEMGITVAELEAECERVVDMAERKY